MGTLIIQNDFTHGQWDEDLLNRTDVASYNAAAKLLRNVVVKPQGGVQRRFGSEFIVDLNLTTDSVQLEGFEFSESSKYLLVFTHLLLTIYKDGIFNHSEITPYTDTILENRELRVAQLAGPTGVLMVIAHEDHPPKNLFRNLVDTTWTFIDAIFKNLPGKDFNDVDYNNSTFDLTKINSLETGVLNSTLPIFDSSYVGGYFIGVGAGITDFTGIAKLDSLTSTTKMVATVLQSFDNGYKAQGVSGRYIVLQKPAFSIAKGWPRTVAFYQNRLVFGGSKSLPQSIFLSWEDDFFNFNVSVGNPSNAIQVTIGASEIDKIQHTISDRSLQIFTINSEFAVPQGLDDSITPANISLTKQGSEGSTSVNPRVFDNQTVFVKKGGKGVDAFVFNNQVRSYNSADISTFSQSLIRSPIDSAIFKGSDDQNASYYYLINSDGSIATFQSMRNENVEAWTIVDTGESVDDKFFRITRVGDDIYFVVKRDISNETKYYLEKMDWDLVLDSVTTFSFSEEVVSVTGLDYLNGRTVSIIGDGYILDEQVVQAGFVKLSSASKEITVGLKFLSEIETLPVNTGNNSYVPKRIPRVFIDFLNSLGIIVNGTIIPYMTFGDKTLNEVPGLQTEIFEYLNLEGWPKRDTIKITQSEPIQFNILGIGYEVEI